VQSARKDPIVISGIGLITSVGDTRESTWAAIREGRSGVRRLTGLEGIPDGLLIGAPVDIEPSEPGQLKSITLAEHAAAEAMHDSGVVLEELDRDRFGCVIAGHMGDTGRISGLFGLATPPHVPNTPWWHQWMPNTACSRVANQYGLTGPRLCHSTACASGLIEVLSAVRAIEDNQCDIALAGSSEGIHPLFAAGFRAMRVLAEHDDPQQACRPFDRHRSGFVMGEGAAMFVLERLSHAEARGAQIYAELLGGRMLAEAHHVTDLDGESDALTRLLSETMHRSQLSPADIHYISAHGTGTQQNDVAEVRAIRQSMGRAADGLCLSSAKSMLGHLVNAAGSVELAITALALRDGFAPPTINLTDPDPACDLDCIPLAGRTGKFETALKISVAFGGHLAALALRRWQGSAAVPASHPEKESRGHKRGDRRSRAA
jgi:3-oxoacyl-(acyl-carrier-protein) synthase